MLARLAMRIDLSVPATLALCSALAAAPTMTSPPAPAVKSVAPRVGVMSFDELVRFSDTIVVAKVRAIHEVPRVEPKPPTDEEADDPLVEFDWKHKHSLAIAEADVVRRIQGVGEASKVWFLAEGTWTCDISTAQVGETVLLFLKESTWAAQETALFKSSLAALTGSAPLHDIAHSGRGRMRVRELDEVSWSDIVMPPNFAKGARSGFTHLADLERLVIQTVAQQGAYLRASEAPRTGRIDALDVRVWHDGYRAWSCGDKREAAFVVAGEFAPTRAAFSAAETVTWGASHAQAAQAPARAVLTLVKNGERREVVLPPLDDPSVALDSASAAAVRLWLALTEPLELPREKDPRAGYRALLARGR